MLKEPECLSPEIIRQVTARKERSDFSNHFWILRCDRKVLLRNRFPIDSAELVDLVNQSLNAFLGQCFRCIVAADFHLDGEGVTFNLCTAILIACVIA